MTETFGTWENSTLSAPVVRAGKKQIQSNVSAFDVSTFQIVKVIKKEYS